VTLLKGLREHSPRFLGKYRQVQTALLYLPTQIGFLIGGERVTCHGSKLTNSLGRTKLINSLGKQQLELSTRT